ncbi:hypothetical protein BCV70DRAFT_201615 [Testicularia cyperi]|uniref:DUF7729 domain-containing protein n=1 Tax=Testicularia cyperi TaxID=1882483 RepID=A0A317XKG8_9BASI|nr:hypothetical protein BCV70DRAFT_201615 [Testicularia cyperi]
MRPFTSSIGAGAVAATALVAGLAGTAEAQLDASLISGLSAGCATGLVGIVTNSNISTCLSLGTAVGALTSSGNNSLVPGLNQYLNSAICGTGKPVCSSAQLAAANQSLLQSCASDLQSSSGSNIAALVYYFINGYPQLREAACLQQSNNSQYCLVQGMYALQNATQMPITFSGIQQIISNQTTQQQSLQALAANKTAFCTDCNHGLYTELFQGSSNQQVMGAVSQTCGQSFLDGKIPSTLKQTAANASSTGTASGSGASSTSTSGSRNAAPASFGIAGSHVAALGSALAAVAAGLALL